MSSQNSEGEQKNFIKALEMFRPAFKSSEYQINDSWARKPGLRRVERRMVEEIVPDKFQIAQDLVYSHTAFAMNDEAIRTQLP